MSEYNITFFPMVVRYFLQNGLYWSNKGQLLINYSCTHIGWFLKKRAVVILIEYTYEAFMPSFFIMFELSCIFFKLCRYQCRNPWYKFNIDILSVILIAQPVVLQSTEYNKYHVMAMRQNYLKQKYGQQNEISTGQLHHWLFKHMFETNLKHPLVQSFVNSKYVKTTCYLSQWGFQ